MAYVRLPLELLETWAAARVPGRAWRTLMVLAAHANREGLAWPGPTRIGRLAKIDPADARDALGDLAKAGIISRAGTVPTPNGPANRWQIVGLGRGVFNSGTQGENALCTQGENTPRVEMPPEGRTQGGTQGGTQGEVAPQTDMKNKKKNNSNSARVRAIEPKDILQLLRAFCFKIDDADKFPDAHALVQTIRDKGADLNAIHTALKLALKQFHSETDASEKRAKAKSIIESFAPPLEFWERQQRSEPLIWLNRIKYYRERSFWLSSWGPKPGQAGCRAPKALLTTAATPNGAEVNDHA